MSFVVWHDGRWYDNEQPKLLGPLDHGMSMASVVFDGARGFDGLAPDLDRHCSRVVASAKKMLLAPNKTAAEIEALCREALGRLPRNLVTYIRPMFYATEGFVLPVSESTEFTLVVFALPWPKTEGMRCCFSSYRRPARDMAPTDAKAACVYPNMQRALREANNRGFDNGITLDPSGNVAELCTANLWIAKDGVALTPAANGTFLSGITRRRVAELLCADGVEVVETTLTRKDILEADEVFTTGNYGKVIPITAVEDRAFAAGPVCARAKNLYFEFAQSQPA
ncbi:MAG: branched-chain amino acid aminotransferase [Rhizobiales bacterium]|nr:branched-chain amino acid aminotransferase [Hyphomicrobiales bacterium]